MKEVDVVVLVVRTVMVCDIVDTPANERKTNTKLQISEHTKHKKALSCN
jgi:hypothetical protein